MAKVDSEPIPVSLINATRNGTLCAWTPLLCPQDNFHSTFYLNLNFTYYKDIPMYGRSSSAETTSLNFVRGVQFRTNLPYRSPHI
jgi:hypothetical protein